MYCAITAQTNVNFNQNNSDQKTALQWAVGSGRVDISRLLFEHGGFYNDRTEPQQNGNHLLLDYQTQLILLEHQNKKRLLVARQEHGVNTKDPA